MSVTVILEVTAKPECTEDLIAMFSENFNQTRAYDGCSEATMSRSHDDPNHLALVMTWDKRASYERYLQWRADIGDVQKLAAMAAKEPSIRYFDKLDA